MANIQTTALATPAKAQIGSANSQGVPGGIFGELTMSELAARYSHLAKLGKLFTAYGTVTAPVAFNTAAGVGGPLLWNRPGSGVDCHLLAMVVTETTASAATGSLGITGNGGQQSAPTTTTAITAAGSTVLGNPPGIVQPYNVGTVTNAGATFLPVHQVHTGAVTTDTVSQQLVDLGGSIIIPPGAWGAVAASATLTTGVFGIALLYAELPF